MTTAPLVNGSIDTNVVRTPDMLVGTATSVETVTSNATPGRACLSANVDCIYPHI